MDRSAANTVQATVGRQDFATKPSRSMIPAWPTLG